MYRHPPEKFRREYPWLLYLFVGFFSVLWIVGVLHDQKFTWGAPDGVEIVPEKSPVFFWGSIVFFAMVLVAMVILLARGEADFRQRKITEAAEHAQRSQRGKRRRKKQGR